MAVMTLCSYWGKSSVKALQGRVTTKRDLTGADERNSIRNNKLTLMKNEENKDKSRSLEASVVMEKPKP